MSVDERSVLPTVPGLPWYGVIAVAAVPTLIGAIIDLVRGASLGITFDILFLLGSVAAALLARRSAFFTAAVQPPLVAAVVGLVTLFFASFGDNSSKGLKTVVLNMALPFANTFPWILATVIITTLIILGRRYLLETGEPDSKADSKAKKRRPAPTSGGDRPKKAKPRPEGKSDGRPATGQNRRRPESDDRKKTAPKRAGETQRRKPAPQQERPARPAADTGARPARRAQPQTIPPRQQPGKKGRRTAGQQLRDQSHIEDLTAGFDD